MPLFDTEWNLGRRVGELEIQLESCIAKNKRLSAALNQKIGQVDGLNGVQRQLHDLVNKLKRELGAAAANKQGDR